MSDQQSEFGIPHTKTAISDPQASASLLLVESLIHGLCEKSVLSAAEAVEIVERAIEVQSDKAEVADGHAVPLWQSHALLSSIASSLRVDDLQDEVRLGLVP